MVDQQQNRDGTELSGASATKPSRPRVHAIQNVKGGVGKTTLAVNLAALLAQRYSQKVLIVDADGQCNASLYLLPHEQFSVTHDAGSLYDVFHKGVEYIDLVLGKRHGPRDKRVTHPRKVHSCPNGGGLWLICGSPKLFDIQEIAPEIVVTRIRQWLRLLEKHGMNFDHVFIDCGPSLSSVSLAALRAADGILVPMAADVFSLYGLPWLLARLEQARKQFHVCAKIHGVVLTMYPGAQAHPDALERAKQYTQEIRKICDVKSVPALSATITDDPAYPTSFERREPIALSEQYEALVGELVDVAVQAGLLPGGK